MKLYVVSGAKNGTDNIEGIYYLFTEEGEVLASHFCSHKGYAKSDLYYDRPERIEKYNSRFGEVEVLYLGEDDMTIDKLMKLNKAHAIANGYFNK